MNAEPGDVLPPSGDLSSVETPSVTPAATLGSLPSDLGVATPSPSSRPTSVHVATSEGSDLGSLSEVEAIDTLVGIRPGLSAAQDEDWPEVEVN